MHRIQCMAYNAWHTTHSCFTLQHMNVIPATWSHSKCIQSGLTIACLAYLGDCQIARPISEFRGTPVDDCVVGIRCFQCHLLLANEKHETRVVRRVNRRFKCRDRSIDASTLEACVDAACRPGKDQWCSSEASLLADLAAEATLQQNLLSRDTCSGKN